jgi:hypothetical protein
LGEAKKILDAVFPSPHKPAVVLHPGKESLHLPAAAVAMQLASVLGSALSIALCANMSETSCPSTITVGRGKKSHLDKHEQVQFFFRCVGTFGA